MVLRGLSCEEPKGSMLASKRGAAGSRQVSGTSLMMGKGGNWSTGPSPNCTLSLSPFLLCPLGLAEALSCYL